MISAFFAKWGAKLLAALAVIGTALGALRMYGRSKKAQGRSEERERTTEKIHEKVAKADKVRRDQRTAPDKRLRRFDRNR